MLNALANGELSFTEATRKIEQLKSWKCTRDTFLKEVKVSTWEEAQQKFPRHAKKDALVKFKLKSDKELPQEFKVSVLSHFLINDMISGSLMGYVSLFLAMSQPCCHAIV